MSENKIRISKELYKVYTTAKLTNHTHKIQKLSKREKLILGFLLIDNYEFLDYNENTINDSLKMNIMSMKTEMHIVLDYTNFISEVLDGDRDINDIFYDDVIVKLISETDKYIDSKNILDENGEELPNYLGVEN